ncbi:hypothetical protein ACLKA6_014580 [Drosophila palustris]
MNSLTFLIVLMSLWSTDALVGDPSHPTVKLPFGYVRGLNNGRYFTFESIPYAEKIWTTFQAAYPYNTKWEHPFNATQPPVECLQWNPFIEGEDKVTGSEDCLTLSVYRPLRNLHRHLPVVVDIHGGFFMFGGASKKSVERLMERGNVIVVKIVYRVGPIGFLSTGDSAIPGNLGLKDQRIALEWIKANIASFGGNPRKILVIGNDAGGASIHLHLLKGDFNQFATVAVSVSGNALNPWVMQQSARQRAFELGRNVGCGLLDDSLTLATCLSAKSGAEILRGAQQLQILQNVPLTVFGPVVESADSKDPFITQHPIELIKSGNSSPVPWMVSYVAQDGGYSAAHFLRKQYDGRELLDELNHRWNDLAPLLLYYRDSINDLAELDDYSRDIRQFYMQDESFSTKSYFKMQRMFTDGLFKNGTEMTIKLHRQFGKAPVFAYLYDNVDAFGPSPFGKWLSQREDIPLGPIHGDDFSQIFTDAQRAISENFLNMLEALAKEGRARYGNCEFRNNVKETKLVILHIHDNICDNIEMELP